MYNANKGIHYPILYTEKETDMIEMNLLAQFAAFADAGTLTRAAEQLHTSQPALTRAMKKLELELGVPLFVRSKNHLELTETGRYAVPYAKRVLQEISISAAASAVTSAAFTPFPSATALRSRRWC